MKNTDANCIDLDGPSIQPCEQRLALSASMAGELLLQSLGLLSLETQVSFETQGSTASPLFDTANSVSPPSNVSATDHSLDLFEQASQVHQAGGITGLELTGQGQTVAVIDSGVAWDHVALGGGFGPGYRVVGGWDFAENDDNPYDDGPAGFHGTHIAGALAGNHGSFSGIAPDADIVALRVFDDSGSGRLQWIESALQWVHQHRDSFSSPITTVNLSIGAALNPENYAEATAMLEDDLRRLHDDGILVFAASGNLQQVGSFTGDQVLYPASSSSVVAVASVGNEGELSAFAQRESGILAARGENISSSVPDHVYGWDGKVDDYASLSGTSMATPQVAGASMLVRQAMIEQGLQPTADEILARLRDTSQDQFDATTGESYRVIDLITAVTFESTNISDPVETLDRVDGNNESQSVTLDFTEGVLLRIGEQTYRLDTQDRQPPFVIDVGGGSDSLVIIGSSLAERLVLHPSESNEPSSLVTSLGDFELRGFEQVHFHGGGGPDRATLYDSASNDTLTSQPNSASFTGVGFHFDLSNVPRIYVHATAGGDDAAFMYDSTGDDQLAVRPQFTSLRGTATDGQESFQLAYGFERVYAYAEAGGNDSAELYDSTDDDTLSISSGRAMISSADYQVSTRGFGTVVGIAAESGNDIARIYADAANNRWHSADDLVQWTGESGNTRIARGFERVQAFEDFQAIDLSQQSIPSWLLRSENDHHTDDRDAEARASRLVFEQFGSGW